MLNDSLENGKEFCKFMLTLSVSAIPIYLGLILVALPYDTDKGMARGIALLVPGMVFLMAAIAFAMGFFPAAHPFSLDFPEEVEKARIHIIRRRSQHILIGFICFLLGCFGAMVAIVKAHL